MIKKGKAIILLIIHFSAPKYSQLSQLRWKGQPESKLNFRRVIREKPKPKKSILKMDDGELDVSLDEKDPVIVIPKISDIDPGLIFLRVDPNSDSRKGWEKRLEAQMTRMRMDMGHQPLKTLKVIPPKPVAAPEMKVLTNDYGKYLFDLDDSSLVIELQLAMEGLKKGSFTWRLVRNELLAHMVLDLGDDVALASSECGIATCTAINILKT